MRTLLLIVIGIAGGVMGGMGMGGGTLLIPLLTVCCSLEQHTAQALNLIVFIPMSLVAVAIHIRNKLVDFGQVLPIAIPAVASGVVASLLSKLTGAWSLSRLFGLFLVLLGIYQLITAIIACAKRRKENLRKELEIIDAVPSRSVTAKLD